MSQSVKIVYFSSLITGPWEWGHIPIPSPKIILFMLIPLSEEGVSQGGREMSHGPSLVRGTSYQSREALSKVSNCFLKATVDPGQVS